MNTSFDNSMIELLEDLEQYFEPKASSIMIDSVLGGLFDIDNEEMIYLRKIKNLLNNLNEEL